MDVLAITDISISDNETRINLLGFMPKSYANIVMVQTRNIDKLVDMIKIVIDGIEKT
jgi:ribonucleotide reductase alpha subunit